MIQRIRSKGKTKRRLLDEELHGGAEIIDPTFETFRFSRLTDFPSVPDQQVAGRDPVFSRDYLHEIGFDFFRIRLTGKSEAFGEPFDVRVNDNSFRLAEIVSQDDIGGFSTDTRQLHEVLHRVGHLPVIPRY